MEWIDPDTNAPTVGCRLTHHKGPFLDEYQKSPRVFEFPDWRVQMYFKKVVSISWQDKMEKEYNYSDQQLLKKIKQVIVDDGDNGVLCLTPNMCSG